MDKYIYDENNELWYELQGECYLPCLTLPLEEEKPIGIWGQRHFPTYAIDLFINLWYNRPVSEK